MVLDESMHKSIVLLGANGGGKNEKQFVMDVQVNNWGLRANNEGVGALSKEVSTVGMTLAGTVGPYESW